jgi:hypothetical protein|tara:strand:- start:600 stop:1163 length:564 start_codon:yes stop_codon:yes gene_type:complete
MTGRLAATLFIPYLIIGILGSIADNNFSPNQDNEDQLINNMLNTQIEEVRAIGASGNSQQEENTFKAGFSFLKDASGTMFGFGKLLFKVLTLNQSWWSGCEKSTKDNPGYNLSGAALTSPSGNCYIYQDGTIAKDSPQAFMMVRYLLLVMGLPAMFMLMFKSAELFARFINAVGSGLGSISTFIRGF